jgi:TonB-dependent receptor
MTYGKKVISHSGWMLGASSLAMVVALSAGSVAYAQDSQDMETVVVTGFRASLEKALDMKRNSLDASDSILAEDVAKFPDMNVSESLQRIPGVALSRESGEGREITVRGLGPQFSRVRINGMEVLATTGGQNNNTSGGGVNRGRGFDFNVFASELFSQLTVHKSASADVEEGSLGATVDLATGHPFDKPGFNLTTSAQLGYQEYGGAVTPRIAAVVSNTFLGGRLGVLFSGAYAIQNTLEEGTDNGQWISDKNAGTTASSAWQYASVNGLTSGADFTAANAAFRPRFPRYAGITLHSKRLGLTGSVQWQPEDNTMFTLDGMFADFAQVRTENYMEGMAFSASGVTGSTYYPRRITQSSATSYCMYSGDNCAAQNLTTVQLYTHATNLINYTPADINPANNEIYRAKLTNVGMRSESRLDTLDTRFMQLTLDGKHSFSEQFKIHTLFGWSESHHRNPISTTLTADLGCVNAAVSAACVNGGAGTASNPYAYDYSTGSIPLINDGLADATDATGWYLSQIRERAAENYNAFRTLTADFEYAPFKEVKFQGGLDYRNYGYRTVSLRRSNGTNTNMDQIIPGAIQLAFVADPNKYSLVYGLRAINAPKGSTTSWAEPNLSAFSDAFHIWDQSASIYPFANAYAAGACLASGAIMDNSASQCGAFHMGIEPDISNNGSVNENDYGAWLQTSWETEFYGKPFRGSIGARYILTEQTASGYILNTTSWAITPQIGKQTYHDILPSANLVFEPADDFVIRVNANYAMARPALTGLLPGGTATVAGSNWAYSVGNPDLKPTRSKNLDMSFEWYYHKGSMISIALFYKHLDTISMGYSGYLNWATGTGNTAPSYYGVSDETSFAAACGLTLAQWQAGATSSTCSAGRGTSWKYSTTVNSKGGPLYGTEINWQQTLDFLPGLFGNFGVLGNATFVQAQQNYPVSGILNGQTVTSYTADLIGLSRTSYNGTIYYDDTVFQARLTASFRSHFLIDSGLNYLNQGTYAKSSLNLDASSSYKIDENFMVTVDALNLTNQPTEFYIDGVAKRDTYTHYTGRTLFLGLRYSY